MLDYAGNVLTWGLMYALIYLLNPSVVALWYIFEFNQKPKAIEDILNVQTYKTTKHIKWFDKVFEGRTFCNILDIIHGTIHVHCSAVCKFVLRSRYTDVSF